MPSDTKQIRFEIIGDARSLSQTLEQAVRSMSNFAKQMAQASGGLIGGNLAGGGPHIPGAGTSNPNATSSALSKSVEENKRILDNLKGASAETLRTMSDIASREMDREKKAVDSLNASLDNLNRKYESLRTMRNAIGNDPAATYFEKEMESVASEVRAKNDKRKDSEENIKILKQIAGDDGSGGGGGIDWNKPIGAGGGMRSFGRSAGLAVGGATAIANELVAENFDYFNNAARQGQAFKTVGLSTAQGDLSYIAALQSLDSNERKDLLNIGDSKIAYGINQGVGGAAKSLLQGNPDFLGEGLRAVMNLDSKQKEDLRKALELKKQADPTKYAHLAEFQQEAGGRVSAMRLMGGGAGLNPMLDAGGKLGFMPDQVIGQYAAIVNKIGREGATKLTHAVLQGMTTGMDQGVLTQLATVGAMTGQSGLATLISSQGGMNLAARNTIGAAMAHNALGAYGPQDVRGLGGMLSFGTGGAGGALAAQQNVAGIGGLNQLLSGSYDPYQKGMNWLYASRNAGPNASIYTMKNLAGGLDATSLAAAFSGGKLPAHLRATGVTSKMIQGQFNDITGSMLQRIVAEGGADTPMAGAARALGGGGNFKDKLAKYIGKGKGQGERIENVAALFNSAYDVDMNTGEGMVRDMLGLGRKMRAGKGGGKDGAAGSDEFAQLKQQTYDYMKESRDSWKNISELLHSVEKETPAVWRKLFESLGEMSQSSTDAARSLSKLSGGVGPTADTSTVESALNYQFP